MASLTLAGRVEALGPHPQGRARRKHGGKAGPRAIPSRSPKPPACPSVPEGRERGCVEI